MWIICHWLDHGGLSISTQKLVRAYLHFTCTGGGDSIGSRIMPLGLLQTLLQGISATKFMKCASIFGFIDWMTCGTLGGKGVVSILYRSIIECCVLSGIKVPIAILGAEDDHPDLFKQYGEVLAARPEVYIYIHIYVLNTNVFFELSLNS